VRLDLEGVEISAGGWRERCETEIISAGAYVVAVTTVIPSRRLALASSYLSELAGQTAAAHMCLTVRPVRLSSARFTWPVAPMPAAVCLITRWRCASCSSSCLTARMFASRSTSARYSRPSGCGSRHRASPPVARAAWAAPTVRRAGRLRCSAGHWC